MEFDEATGFLHRLRELRNDSVWFVFVVRIEFGMHRKALWGAMRASIRRLWIESTQKARPMKTYPVTLLQLGILTGTRAVAGAGLALMFSGKGTVELRKGIGWSLLGVGAVTYILLVLDLLLRNRNGGR